MTTAQPFRLFGDTIDLYSRDRQLERVVALHKGNASNDDVVMLAERIDLRSWTRSWSVPLPSGRTGHRHDHGAGTQGRLH